MSGVHICSAILDLKEYLEKALASNNKGLRANIQLLVDRMNIVHENHLQECVNKKEENNQYFT